MNIIDDTASLCEIDAYEKNKETSTSPLRKSDLSNKVQVNI